MEEDEKSEEEKVEQQNDEQQKDEQQKDVSQNVEPQKVDPQKFYIDMEYYGQLIKNFPITNDYNVLIQDICYFTYVPPEQFKSLKVMYKDDDGDCIIIKTKEDYEIFYENVKNKVVSKLITEINYDDENMKPEPKSKEEDFKSKDFNINRIDNDDDEKENEKVNFHHKLKEKLLLMNI